MAIQAVFKSITVTVTSRTDSIARSHQGCGIKAWPRPKVVAATSLVGDLLQVTANTSVLLVQLVGWILKS